MVGLQGSVSATAENSSQVLDVIFKMEQLPQVHKNGRQKSKEKRLTMEYLDWFIGHHQNSLKIMMLAHK